MAGATAMAAAANNFPTAIETTEWNGTGKESSGRVNGAEVAENLFAFELIATANDIPTHELKVISYNNAFAAIEINSVSQLRFAFSQLNVWEVSHFVYWKRLSFIVCTVIFIQPPFKADCFPFRKWKRSSF